MPLGLGCCKKKKPAGRPVEWGTPFIICKTARPQHLVYWSCRTGTCVRAARRMLRGRDCPTEGQRGVWEDRSVGGFSSSTRDPSGVPWDNEGLLRHRRNVKRHHSPRARTTGWWRMKVRSVHGRMSPETAQHTPATLLVDEDEAFYVTVITEYQKWSKAD